MEYTKGKYNYVKRIEQSFPCGCHVDEMIDESYGITCCPKHKAAPDMYEALKIAEVRIHNEIRRHPEAGDYRKMLQDELRSVLECLRDRKD